MNRLNFFTRTRGEAANPNPENHPSEISADDPYDYRSPLSPRIHVLPSDDDGDTDTDLEAQHTSPAATAAAAEMTERGTPRTRLLHRFRPPIPSFFTVASSNHNHQTPRLGGGGRGPFRPTSSAYSGEGVRGAPDTVLNLGLDGLDSPKSPDYVIRDTDMHLPGTRLHLPNLTRTWTQGSNGPPTRPGTGRETVVAEPEPAVVRPSRGRRERGHGHGGGAGEEHRERRREHRQRRRHHRREGSGSSSSGSGSRRSGRTHRSERSSGSGGSGSPRSRRSREDGERRSERRRRDGEGSSSLSSSRGSRSSRRDRRPPKNFLFCFPWVQSRRIRSQILRCFVSGLFLALTLTVYLSLSLTHNVNSNEFTIVLILILLAVTVFFCHSLIRLCMLVVKARKREQAVARGQLLPDMVGPGPGGYAIPRAPIPVVLARDEEAAGIESEATKTGPPAYGMWRQSVRVDPNRLYWARNERVPVVEDESDISSSSSSSSNSSGSGDTHRVGTHGNIPRPPSYSSDDGVSYVVDARPRSTAPRGNVPLAGSVHPSESEVHGGSWV